MDGTALPYAGKSTAASSSRSLPRRSTPRLRRHDGFNGYACPPERWSLTRELDSRAWRQVGGTATSRSSKLGRRHGQVGLAPRSGPRARRRTCISHSASPTAQQRWLPAPRPNRPGIDMCGIAGFVDTQVPPSWERCALSPRDTELRLRAMCDAIRHRGPDDEGAHVAPGVALGMRRLSIIDVATGHQPLHNEDRTVWVVFNGEIYNYLSLRRELEDLGHRFYTQSDTESIVHAYEQWGEGVFRRLRGMFGVAIWDARQRLLLLGRDRLGIKPLHYGMFDRRLYFGSEIKALLAGLDEAPPLDYEALDHYLSFLYTPRDASIFSGIQKLPPGHSLRFQNGCIAVSRYWAV